MYYNSLEITNWKDNKVFEILENSIGNVESKNDILKCFTIAFIEN